MNNNVLHVFSVPFSINYFVGEQFIYLANKKKNKYFVACSDDNSLNEISCRLKFNANAVEIKRSINPIADLKAIFSIYKLIKQNNISKIVGHSPKGGMVAMIAGFLAGVSSRVYFRHGIFFETTAGIKRILLKNIDRLSGTLATNVVCVSHAVQDISEREKLNSPQKNIILGLGTCNGIDVKGRFNPENYANESEKLRDKLGINANDFVVGFVGRLVKDKGINELVEAWRIFSSRYKNVKLLLVGPLEVRDPISEKTKLTIENTPSIICTGNVSETPLYYTAMDVFILPTYREGFPTVALEASSMKIPVLITNATGCAEAVIDTKTGFFITTETEDIIEKLELLMNNSQLRISMGENGYKFVGENFEQTKIWDIIDEKLDL